jgi:hypothetical protein
MMNSVKQKLLNISLGDGRVDTSSPVKAVFEELFSIYDGFQKLLEPSAYVGQDEQGRRIRELFPQPDKKDVFDSLREKFKEAKRRYLSLQNEEVTMRPDLKAKYFSKTFNKKSDKATFNHAEENCWPNSTNDKRVQAFTQSIDKICSLASLREQFETQLQVYCSARNIFEATVTKIETNIAILESHTEMDSVARFTKTAEDALKKGINEAEETARTFNALCLWAISNVQPSGEFVGHLSWYDFYYPRTNTFSRRSPWHQHVNKTEANDIFEVVTRLTDTATVLQQYGIETDISKINKLLKPDYG